jgi:hypothetical protein
MFRKLLNAKLKNNSSQETTTAMAMISIPLPRASGSIHGLPVQSIEREFSEVSRDMSKPV